MYNQRPLNSSSPLHPRNGAPKNPATDNVPVAHGMRSRTAPHSAVSGSPFDDEPLQKTYEGVQVPINPGTHPSLTKSNQRGIPGDGNAILHEAARLGRCPAAITSGGSAPGANGPATTTTKA
jgi:hypothetical protein